MSERDALLRAVLMEPADDVRRLAYADWLMERGEPAGRQRGLFVRYQLDRAYHDSMGDTGDRSTEYPEADDLWPNVEWPDSAHSLFAIAGDRRNIAWRWRRGFIDRLELPAAEFFRHAEAVFRAHPVEEVRLTDAPVHPSGGNGTYYLGGLGRFPREYWRSLEGHRTRADVLKAASAACVAHGRAAAEIDRAP